VRTVGVERHDELGGPELLLELGRDLHLHAPLVAVPLEILAIFHDAGPAQERATGNSVAKTPSCTPSGTGERCTRAVPRPRPQGGTQNRGIANFIVEFQEGMRRKVRVLVPSQQVTRRHLKLVGEEEALKADLHRVQMELDANK
jgi:hypothetical protein